jgi:hypothetical protein
MVDDYNHVNSISVHYPPEDLVSANDLVIADKKIAELESELSSAHTKTKRIIALIESYRHQFASALNDSLGTDGSAADLANLCDDLICEILKVSNE